VSAAVKTPAELLKGVTMSSLIVKSIPTRGLLRKPTPFNGDGVAISRKKAVLTTHGKLSQGTPVVILTREGAKLTGRIGFCRFNDGIVDIAVVDLDDDCEFRFFTPVKRTAITCGEKIIVVGPDFVLSDPDCCVKFIDGGHGSSMLRTSYYPFGSGVVTARCSNGHHEVVGVHIATVEGQHEENPRPLKRLRSASKNPEENLNGWCTVCEIARVPDLLAYLL
jgi:hypothetical protein